MDFFHSPMFPSYVEDLMREYHVPGLAIAIVQNDQIISAGYGKASLEEDKPCTADTLFDVGSVAKSLTAAAVALLVQDNETHPEVQWDAAMSQLLPDDFVMSGAGYTEGVTVEDVLSHRSGMPGHDCSYLGARAAHPDDAKSITRNLRNLPVAAPIRAKYLYCNMMYTVATYLVEVKAKQSFARFLEERIFNPLGMHATSLQPENARAKGLEDRLATGYYWDKDTSEYQGSQSLDCPEGQGAGSIITSVNDFVKWLKALLYREEPINDKVYQGLVRMRSFPNPTARRLKPYTSPAIYAAGIEIYYYRGHMVIGHDGMIPSFASRFFLIPDLKFGAVILGNSTGVGPVGTILTRDLIDEVIKLPETERSNRYQAKKAMNGANASDFGHQKTIRKQKKKQNQKNKRGKVKQATVSDSKLPESQKIRLSAYIGSYWHPGYHTLTVEEKDGRLFVDATDRSMGFTLTFEHISEETSCTAYLSDFIEGGNDPVQAQFIFANGKATKLGLQLEIAMKELIWFERRED